jgi:hypothetical protein
VSTRASNAIVVISFRMMDLPSWGGVAGSRRPAGLPTATALLSFQIAQPIFKIGQKGS